MNHRLLLLALVLFCRAEAQAQDDFPHSLARLGEICPNPDNPTKRFVCHSSRDGDTRELKEVDLEAVNGLLQAHDSLPGHFAWDGLLYDCDCNLVTGTEFPCTADDCCAESPLINQDIGAHVEDDCPTQVGDPSRIGCVEFSGCRYDVEPCKTDECCEKSPLRNPDLPVQFDASCPLQNGDESHGGCIEFTGCKYVDFRCDDDECCSTDARVHANPEFSVHFDDSCPTEDGDLSKVGCIAFTGCMYGEDDNLPCHTDACCLALSVTNHDPSLGVHVDENCPKKDGDVSLVGCVEFTGCRYNVGQCDNDDCCAKNALRNPSLPVKFNSECPAKNGDVSIVGCIEFTQCQYIDSFVDNVPCTADGGDVCCATNPNVPQNPNAGVHFDHICPTEIGVPVHVGCVGLTGCRVGSAGPCDDDLCCDLNTKVNHDPRLNVHFDATCPVKDGDTSLVGCVEFTQCRYDVEQCTDQECCEKNALRNPQLPVIFNVECPAKNGDVSIVGCIEFTQCQYVTDTIDKSSGCTDNDCCQDNDEVNHNPLLGVHFDGDCPTVDGDTSHSECVGFTGCRYGAIPACKTDDCCENLPVVNRDLEIHVDDGCPTTEGDPSLVGCVQFTGCRYEGIDATCKTDDCCNSLKIRNPDLPVKFNGNCPEVDGDTSIVGCIEFTQCQYTETFPDDLICFDKADGDACCDANPIVNHGLDLEVHFNDQCPAKDGDVSIIGCVEFTGCKYKTAPCPSQQCCDHSPIVNQDPSLNAHVDTSCPAINGDVSLVGCVEFTQCRYGAVGACTDDDCCQKNALRNPEIPVVFDSHCPAVNGETSLIGCIEFTQCRYTNDPPTPPPCKDDGCCALNQIVNHDALLAVHFDPTCPVKDGDFSVVGCVEFTGCRYGVAPPCVTDECCLANPITNHDPSLNVHADPSCPRKDGDVSEIGCVEFTGCRYDEEQCGNDACCAKNALRNPDLPVKFNANCPKVDGDTSIVGCIEFTQCQYVDTIVQEQVCADDFCCATTTNIDAPTGVHFDADCPTEVGQNSKVGCVGFTGCAIGASSACADDECCAKNGLVNQDPSLDAHFDHDCPTKFGDFSLVGCVEFTGCRYSDVGCKTDDCCEKNALRNPDLPVVFDAACPLKDGDVSIVGCIEFTQCRYTVAGIAQDVVCTDDICCNADIDLDAPSTSGVHFDSECPTEDGEKSVVGCIRLTGCRFGAEFSNPCGSDECCKANPLVNQDESLSAHFDATCPTEAADVSLIGCVEFTGCRYGNQDGPCDTDECCEKSTIVNHDPSLTVHHDASCPRKNGDVSIIGCVEFTGCKYGTASGQCSDNACCDASPLVNHDPSLGAHFDANCPEVDGDTSMVGCVEFTMCRYFTMTCSSDDCCIANPLVQPDDDLAAHFDGDCPSTAGDPVVQGCVDFTRCRFGDKTFIEERNLARTTAAGNGDGDVTSIPPGGMNAGDIAAILLAVVLFATLSGLGYYCFCRKEKNDRDYIAMENRASA